MHFKTFMVKLYFSCPFASFVDKNILGISPDRHLKTIFTTRALSARRKRQESANGRGMVRMHSLTMHYPHALHDLHGKTVFFVSFCVFCGQKYFGNFA